MGRGGTRSAPRRRTPPAEARPAGAAAASRCGAARPCSGRQPWPQKPGGCGRFPPDPASGVPEGPSPENGRSPCRPCGGAPPPRPAPRAAGGTKARSAERLRGARCCDGVSALGRTHLWTGSGVSGCSVSYWPNFVCRVDFLSQLSLATGVFVGRGEVRQAGVGGTRA